MLARDLVLSGIVLASFVLTASIIGRAADLPSYSTSASLHTINLAGPEFGGKNLPGVLNKDYVYPSNEDLSFFLDEGMQGVRLPFRWERVQRELGGKLHKPELREIDRVVKHITQAGGLVILDVHNYGRYRGEKVGSEAVSRDAFADLWRRLAERYGENDQVIFGLMNEPHGIPAEDWAQSAQVALDAIRAAGAANLILVSGTAWSGAHSWISSGNGAALATINDPLDHFAFEAHQYLDADYSGTRPTCQSATIGSQKLKAMTGWLTTHGHKAFLGEFAGGPDDTCLAALDDMLTFMASHPDQWIGWSYWAAGAWWGDYMFSVHPGPEGITAPQWRVLEKHLVPN